LRGLPPDNVLIMVNGKRRHRSGVIAELGGNLAEGSQGPDLSAIPALAIKQAEILRDGAAAQYGSDAIAGVMNFILRDAADGMTLAEPWCS
jgi:iron complex outermembrane receptor protein